MIESIMRNEELIFVANVFKTDKTDNNEKSHHHYKVINISVFNYFALVVIIIGSQIHITGTDCQGTDMYSRKTSSDVDQGKRVYQE